MIRTALFMLAINAARRASNILIGLAANADLPPITEDQDGWVELVPYGDTIYWNQEPDGKWRQYTQSFHEAEANAMVSAFNALLCKKGKSFKGLPIYSGHPDADPTRWPDERRLGGIMAMRAGAHGMDVKPAWNSLGEENRKEGFLVYPSPAWLYDHRKAQASGVIQPTELRSVGLTNSPRIQDVLPWVNSDDPGAPEGAPTQSQSEANDPAPAAKKMNYKKMLTQHLGVAEDSSDDDIQKAHDTVMQAKKDKEAADAKASSDKAAADQKVKEMQAGVANAESAREAAQTSATKFRALAANALLDSALNAGRISAAERPALETAFNTDFDAAKAQLDAKRPQLNTQRLGLQPTGDDLSTPALRQFAYNCRADALKREKNLHSEDEVAAAMRADDKGKTIIAAMEAAK